MSAETPATGQPAINTKEAAVAARTATVLVKLTEVEPVKSILGELAWLTENSEGVVGLRIDGEQMPWAEVIRLYMPTLAARLRVDAD